MRSQFRSPEAIAEFERAVELDPAFGLAWIALAEAYSQLNFNLFDPETAPAIENALQRSFETMPDRWEPHAARAFRLWTTERDWSGAARELEVAMTGTGVKTPVDWGLPYASFLVQVDKATEAVPLLFAARSADPLSANVSGGVAWFLTIAGREEDALREFDRLADLAISAPNVWTPHRLHAALAVNNPDRIAMLLDYWSSLPGAPVELAELATVWGSPLEAAGVLRALTIDPDQPPIFIEIFAPIAGYLGDVELALAILQRSYLEAGNTFTLYLWHPLLADVRRTDGFKELVIELGFPDYWREFGWGEHCRPVGADDFECQ